MGIKSLLFLSISFWGSSFCLVAQSNDTNIVQKNGRSFKEIVVTKGQTLYSLSKASGVAQDSLLQYNKNLDQGLKAGMKILIPIPTAQKKSTPADEKSALKHEVKAGETIFGIAKKYGLSQEELIAQNPDLKAGLKTGIFLTIHPKPGKPTSAKEHANEEASEPPDAKTVAKACEISASFVKNNIAVSLILPLYSTKDDSQIKSRTGLEFYAGCMLAIDSLKNSGLNIDLHVFDTQSDSLAMNRILKSDELLKSDFILGPLHASEFRQVSNVVSKKNILTVAPLASSSALITGAPQAAKLIPDQKRLVDGLVHQVLLNYKNARFVLIRNSNAKDKEITEFMASALAARMDTNSSSYVNVAYTGVNDLLSKLDNDKENILFFPSTAQVQVIDAIARLNALRNGKRITLVGLNEWNNFENIEYEHLNNLNFTYAAPWYVNYNTVSAKKFRRRYREEFKGEPGVYAFQGFDAMHFFVEAAARSKDLNAECLTDYPLYKGFCADFKFTKENANSGAENNRVFVLQLSDFLAAPINKP